MTTPAGPAKAVIAGSADSDARRESGGTPWSSSGAPAIPVVHCATERQALRVQAALPDRDGRSPAAHQHLRGALGPQEVQVAEGIHAR